MEEYQIKYKLIDEKPPHNVPLKAQYKKYVIIIVPSPGRKSNN